MLRKSKYSKSVHGACLLNRSGSGLGSCGTQLWGVCPTNRGKHRPGPDTSCGRNRRRSERGNIEEVVRSAGERIQSDQRFRNQPHPATDTCCDSAPVPVGFLWRCLWDRTRSEPFRDKYGTNVRELRYLRYNGNSISATAVVWTLLL